MEPEESRRVIATLESHEQQFVEVRRELHELSQDKDRKIDFEVQMLNVSIWFSKKNPSSPL